MAVELGERSGGRHGLPAAGAAQKNNSLFYRGDLSMVSELRMFQGRFLGECVLDTYIREPRSIERHDKK